MPVPYNCHMTRRSAVYCLRVGDKFYIGASIKIGSRRTTHFADLKSGKHACPPLQEAWNQKPEPRLRMDVLEFVEDPAELPAREQWWIDFTDQHPARCNVLTRVCMREQWQDPGFRKKMSELSSGRHTPETKAVQRAAWTGSGNPRARACWFDLAGVRLEFGSAAEAARNFGVPKNTLDNYMQGRRRWPVAGGRHTHQHLTGLTGGYLK